MSPFSALRVARRNWPFRSKTPAGDAVGVLAHQRLFAGGDLQLVEVVPGLVAVVQADVENVRDRSSARR